MSEAFTIRRLEADEPAFDLIARWRYEAFFAQDGGTFEDSRDALHAWMGGLGYETALLAEVVGRPAGSCLPALPRGSPAERCLFCPNDEGRRCLTAP